MLEIPMPIAKWLGERIVAPAVLFAEEWEQLSDASYELHTDPRQLINFRVSSECSFFDLLTVIRAFIVMQRLTRIIHRAA